MDRGRIFDSVATLYDAHRSGYPTALFADIMTIGRLRPGHRVLEVGCGSGPATSGFVAEGLDVTGIDPGASLVGLARQKFKASDAVRFEVAAFEEWPLEARKFHLVAAAQSWHWVRGDVAFARAAGALAPDGSLAIFGHTMTWSNELIEILEPIYLAIAPELWSLPPENWYLPHGPISELIAASGRFEHLEHRSYAWRRDYSPKSFSEYLGTRSDHARLPERRRAELLHAIEATLPDTIAADWVTNLYVASLK
jgi:SAM-dependent methyltransferase